MNHQNEELDKGKPGSWSARGAGEREKAGHAQSGVRGPGTSSLPGRPLACGLALESVSDPASPSLPSPTPSGSASLSTEAEKRSHRGGETEAEGGVRVQASRSWKPGSQSHDAPWVLPSPAASPGRLPAMTLGWSPPRIPRRGTQEAAMTDSLRTRGTRSGLGRACACGCRQLTPAAGLRERRSRICV